MVAARKIEFVFTDPTHFVIFTALLTLVRRQNLVRCFVSAVLL